MKKKRKMPPLGKRSMEAAGSLTPDLEGQSRSHQHTIRGPIKEIDSGQGRGTRKNVPAHSDQKAN